MDPQSTQSRQPHGHNPRTPTKPTKSGRRGSILDDFDFPPPPSQSRSNSVAQSANPPNTADARPGSVRQTLSDDSPVASRRSRQESWSSDTRDSVVENLLMSFDRMGGRMPGQDVSRDRRFISDDDDSFDSSSGPAGIARRARTHNQSSSVSSAAGSNRTSPAPKREGLSKRLSQASFETLSTLRNGAHITKRTKGSLTSTSAQASRSASIASRNDDSPHAPHMLNESLVERGRPVPSVFSPFEVPTSTRKPSEHAAAPSESQETRAGSSMDAPGGFSTFSPFQVESTVPAGSRKLSAPLSPVLSQTSSRKNSPKIPSAPSQTSLVHTPEIPQTIRDQASDFVRASTMRSTSRSPNVSPHLNQSGFATPQRATRPTPPSLQKHNSAPADAIREKDKSGFFRRVFKNTGRSASAQDMAKQNSSDPSAQYANRPEETPSSKTYQSSPAHAAPQARPEPSRADSSPANGVINKKSSSFFRRRKRSMTESDKPPPLPPQLNTPVKSRQDPQLLDTPIKSRQEQPKSPGASSLTRAMDQYLDNIDSSPSTKPSPQIPMSSFAAGVSEDEEDEDPDIFHSGYTPPPDASLRRPAPHEHSRQTTPATTPKPSPMLSQLESDSEDEGPKSNTLKVKQKKRPHMLSANTFLNENSDVEGNSKAPSIISVVSSTYGLPAEEFYSPVSPMSAREVENSNGQISYFAHLPSKGGESANRPDITITDSPRVSFEGDGPDFVITAPSRHGVKSPARLRLESMGSEQGSEQSVEDIDDHSISFPVEGIKESAAEASEHTPSVHSEVQSLPSFKLEGNDVRPSVDIARSMSPAPSSVDPHEPTSEDRERARKIYDGDEEFLLKVEAAAWLGEKKPANERTRLAYMALFNWAGQNILSALRSLCGRLVLKGESQVIDRIFESFAHRWDQCNPNNGFKGTSKCCLL